jgi:hypothetical protein
MIRIAEGRVRLVRRLKKLVRRNEKILTFVGALIVFATFVIREGVRERSKESADAMRAATISYTNFKALEYIIAIESTPPDIVKKMENLSSDRYEDGQERQKAEDIVEVRPYLERSPQIAVVESMQANLYVEPFSNIADKRKTMEDCSDIVNKAHDRLNSVPILSKEQLRAMSAAKVQEFIDTYERWDGMMQKDAGKALQEVESLKERAQSETERAKRNYELSTLASYVLYTIGWGLGLLAKVFGSGSVEAD